MKHPTDARWKTSVNSNGARLGAKRTICGFDVRVSQHSGGCCGWHIHMSRGSYEFSAKGLPTENRARSLAYDIARKLASLPDTR